MANISPHIHQSSSVANIMHQVIWALLPAILVSTYILGIGVIIHCIIAIVTALISEGIILALRHKPVKETLQDSSAVVASLLFVLCLPPYTVWWVTVIGVIFAIAIAKHVFGGLGNNPFNPAMAAYVFVLLCFPTRMNEWINIADHSSLYHIFIAPPIDALSQATPLSHLQTELDSMAMINEIMTDERYGLLSGVGLEWIAVAYLIGGIALLIKGTIRWQIPCAVLLGLSLSNIIFGFVDNSPHASLLFHLFTVSTMLCAFFIATDPSSSASTTKGKWIYGLGIGCLIYLIRAKGSYADGVAFAVLMMNCLVPLIDLYTRPKITGQ